MFTSAVVIIQTAKSNPKLGRGFHFAEAKGSNRAVITLTTNAHLRRVASSGKLAFFQRAIGPMPIKNIAGAISGTNTRLKYGGPTESFPIPSASTMSGYRVPRRHEPAATVRQPFMV